MMKATLLLFTLVSSSIAFAKTTPEQDYKAATACLQNLNEDYQYQWTSGSGPSTFDAKTGDTFIVLPGTNAGFVRFGSTTTTPQRCTFKMIHNASRDCVKIQDANGQDIVTMSYIYPPEKNRIACDPNNAESTTRFLYNNDSNCTNMSYEDLNPILQKQIARNTQKMIEEKKMSRATFDASHRKACESIYNLLRRKYAPGVGSDYGAIVNDAVRSVPQGAEDSVDPNGAVKQ